MKKSITNRMLSRESERIFNRTFIVWTIIAIFIGYLANDLGVKIEACNLCEKLSFIIPSIERWPYHTVYFYEARIIWLYLPLTSPIILFYLLYKIKDITNDKAILVVIIFFVILFLIGFFLSFIGFPYYEGMVLKKSGHLTYLFSQTLYGMILISTSFWVIMIGTFIILLSWVINIFKH
jgi:hypothetical protein